MATKKEIALALIAVQNKFVTKDVVKSALRYQKKAKLQGKDISLINHLHKNKLLSKEHIEEIKSLYKAKKAEVSEKNLRMQSQELSIELQVTPNGLEIKGMASPNDATFVMTNSQEPTIVVKEEKSSSLGEQTLPSSPTIASNEISPDQRVTRMFTPKVKEGESFAHYQILGKLGQGGMGAVYKANDSKLKRIVALKLITSQSGEMNIKRFMQEAQATANIEHPNIVRIFEIGDTPQNYFTMEYIEGGTLKGAISKQLPTLEIVKILLKITMAIHTAHQKGIIHRDIKPANIMLAKNKEPKVMDFGLAKVVDSDLSRTGDTMGTPAYMPPEQAHGLPVDVRSDVYSLGATLYEMVTGRPPFRGESPLNILHQVLSSEPIPPRLLNPDIPKELEAICLKCLEKKSTKRYHNAEELGNDLKNFINNKPIVARPPNALQRFVKFIDCNRWPSFATALVAVLLIFGAGWFMEKRHSALALELEKKQVKLAFSKLATDDNWQVRVALAKIPITPIHLLNKMAQDEDWRVKSAVAMNEKVDTSILQMLAADEDVDVRAAIAANPKISIKTMLRLAKDNDHLVRMALASNFESTETILKLLAKDKHWQVRQNVAHNPKISRNIINLLSLDQEEEVRAAIASNPSVAEEILLRLTSTSRNALTKERGFDRKLKQKTKSKLMAFAEGKKVKEVEIAIGKVEVAKVEVKKNTPHGLSSAKCRLAAASNSNLSVKVLKKLARDQDAEVRFLAVANINTTVDILNELSKDPKERVRDAAAARHPNTSRKEMQKLYKKYHKDLVMKFVMASNLKVHKKILENLMQDAHQKLRAYATVRHPDTKRYKLAKILHKYHFKLPIKWAIANHPNVSKNMLKKLSKDANKKLSNLAKKKLKQLK